MDRTRHKTQHKGIYYRNGSDDPEVWPRRYIVWYADSAGIGRTVTMPQGANLKDALARQAELRGKAARGERIVVSKQRLCLFADAWLEEQQGILKPKTLEGYTWAIEKHIKPFFGQRQLTDVTVDDVARLIAKLQRDGKKAWTIRAVLTPLRRIFRTAERRGLVASNPVSGLDRSERPKSDQRRMQILSSDEISRLLPKVPARYRDLITTLVFTGMRIGEALALTWDDVDFAGGFIHVRAGKTDNAARSIVLMPALGSLLRRRWLAAGRPEGLVFSSDGKPFQRRVVLRSGLSKGLEAAKLDHVTLHELRHTFASILIGQGFDVTFVADQLGHADPGITLRTYAKLFDPAARREEARTRLQDAFGAVVSA